MALEKQLEQYLVRECKKRKLITWKLTSPGRRGIPDRIIMGRGKVAFRELKRPGGKPTPLQAHVIEQLVNHGLDAGVLDNKAAVDELLDYLTDT